MTNARLAGVCNSCDCIRWSVFLSNAKHKEQDINSAQNVKINVYELVENNVIFALTIKC